MISNKIKAVLYMKGLNLSDLATKLNTSKQSMSNKSSRESYTAKDLVALSDLVGGDLAIIDRIVRRSDGTVQLANVQPHGLKVIARMPLYEKKKDKSAKAAA